MRLGALNLNTSSRGQSKAGVKVMSNFYGFTSTFLLASAFPFSRIVLQQFDANSFAFLRCFFASILLIAIGLMKKIRKPFKMSHIFLFLLSGASGYGLYAIFFNIGLESITSATSSIIISTTPIMTAIAAMFIYRERISKIGMASIFAAFIGVSIIILWDGVLSINSGMIWTVLAAVLFCVYNILNRMLSKMGYTTTEIVTYSIISATLILSVFAGQSFHALKMSDPKHIMMLLYLSVFACVIACFLLSEGLKIAEKTTDITNYIFTTPLMVTVMSYLLLGEYLNTGTIIGGAIIMVSIIVFALKGKPKDELGISPVEAER